MNEITQIVEILEKKILDKDDIILLLKSEGESRKTLFEKSAEIKKKYVDNKTYFRGLVEFSNICSKNCLYCGIRKDNKNLLRYNLNDEEILDSVKFALKSNYASIVLQSGEISGKKFIDRVDNLIKKMMEIADGNIGITLSCGEQDPETYLKWKSSGAKRYLLRIESSNEELYYKIHPNNKLHNFQTRLNCLKSLKEIGYQTGTGVMIGLPFQDYSHLADDLIFMRDFDIDMCGMGPYIEHKDTPLYEYRDKLLPLQQRFDLSLKMIAILRIMMKDINIAAATAMQTIDKMGREKALKVGANVIMPNITPGKYRDYYKLYENKPCTDEEAEDCLNCMEIRVNLAGDSVGYGEYGDSIHYKQRISN